jgi:hypothetical protein
MPEDLAPLKKGDFVRSRKGLRGTVGVVWQIHSNHIASVVVYWRATDASRVQQDYEPKDLELVPLHEVPEYAIELKKGLGL